MTVATTTAAPIEEKALRGRNPYNVIEAIKARHARQSTGDFGGDGHKLGLVIEGGALRAVCSAGGAVVLAQLGYSDVFDEVYATSAAVMNASYFLTNQPLLGISVYFDHCTTRDFVNPFRFWKIIDVDYIFDRVAVRDKPLDIKRLLASRSRLFVAVLDRNTGEVVLVDPRESKTPVLQVLKASAAIPVFYNRAVTVDGRACIDGGLTVPFALPQAIANGCTDVLVLSTRPPDYVTPPPTWLDRHMFNVMCARWNRRMRHIFAERHLSSRAARDLACGVANGSAVNVATICTSPDEIVDRMTIDRDALLRAAIGYGKRTMRIFGGDADAWTLPTDYTSIV